MRNQRSARYSSPYGRGEIQRTSREQRRLEGERGIYAQTLINEFDGYRETSTINTSSANYTSIEDCFSRFNDYMMWHGEGQYIRHIRISEGRNL